MKADGGPEPAGEDAPRMGEPILGVCDPDFIVSTVHGEELDPGGGDVESLGLRGGSVWCGGGGLSLVYSLRGME